MYVMGLDIGTSGVKSTIFDERAHVVAHAHAEYDLLFPAAGHVELDPNVLWEKSREVIQGASERCPAGRIDAICITSFGESFICLDGDQRVLANTMIYMDSRGVDECAELQREIAPDVFYGACGHSAAPMFPICKMRHLFSRRPDILARTRHICFVADFVAMRLGAGHLCDHSLAARSAMFDIRNKRWWDEALRFAGVSGDIMPEPVPSGTVTGRVSPDLARQLGFSDGARILIGGHDQILAAIGSGVRAPGDIANGMGTVDCMTAIVRGDQLNMAELRKHNLQIAPYVGDDMYAVFAFSMSGGCILKWFRDTLARDIRSLPDAYALLNDEMPPAPTDLLLIPYFAGGGTPHLDGETPAVLAGLRLHHGRGDLFRAFLEGESYEMRLNIDCLRQSGVSARRIVAVGGGSASDRWMQIRADLFGVGIDRPEVREAGTLASALLCFVSLGLYRDIAQAQEAVIRYPDHFAPDGAAGAHYQRQYAKYTQLYDCIKEVCQP